MCPGRVATDIFVGEQDHAGLSWSASCARRPSAGCPRPEEVAQAVAFLASDASSYIVGAETLDGDGGPPEATEAQGIHGRGWSVSMLQCPGGSWILAGRCNAGASAVFRSAVAFALRATRPGRKPRAVRQVRPPRHRRHHRLRHRQPLLPATAAPPPTTPPTLRPTAPPTLRPTTTTSSPPTRGPPTSTPAHDGPAHQPRPTAPVLKVETFVTGLEAPWALDFAPDGRIFLTERGGRIRIIQDGKLLPQPVGGRRCPAATGRPGCWDWR